MSIKINKSSLLATVAVLGLTGTVTVPVFAADGPAGGDSNAPSTNPATNPAITWGGGGNTGSVDTSNPSSATTSGSSMAGISWHTDANIATLSLLRVPNFDFGSWAFTGGASGAGSGNTHWYPVNTGSGIGYDNSGITGTANFIPLQVESSKPSSGVVTDANRVLVVKDNRIGTAGWSVNLKVGAFNKLSGSPANGASVLTGAAIAINPGVITFEKTADNNLTGALAPVATDSRNPMVVYAGGSAKTIFKADQQTSYLNGLGGWIMDFTDKNSALFTSPTEGLGTYTSSLTWTLQSGPS